ncbi:MAG: hypothetical protein HUU02_15910 [Bacteroidetes bacterium]|nr:hypothetical protein [Bacteroidota bacterium]
MMLRPVSIILLVIILFEAGGLAVGIQVRQWIHKAAVAVIMDTGSRPEQIVRMEMSIAAFDRIKIHEREFRLNGEMYDVVWRETDGTDYIIYCFRDAEEEKMIAKFLRFLSNSTSDESTTAQRQGTPVLPGFVFTIPEADSPNLIFVALTIIPLPSPPVPHAGESSIDPPPPRCSPV